MDLQYIAIENTINALDDLLLPSQSIKNGELVAIPGNNTFCIAADALNEQACIKLQHLNFKNTNTPFTIFISDTTQLSNIVEELNDIEKKIIETFWPGPLTIQLRKKAIVPEVISNNSDTININMTTTSVASDLILLSETPIAVTSTNYINNKSDEKISYILNINSNEFNANNTVIKVENSKIQIIEQGLITKEDLKTIY